MSYKCINCGEETDELEKPRCPFCGYRIIAKKGSGFVRRVEAR